MSSLGALIRSTQKGEVLLPVLRKFILEQADQIAAGLTSNHELDVLDAEMTIECFEERRKVRSSGPPPKGEYFHPSALGQCIRKLFFDAKNAPKDFQGKKSAEDLLRWHMILETGTYVHVMVQNLCQRAGVLLRREVPIINRRHKIIGTGDGILRINGEDLLLEIKTINPRDFSSLSQPFLEHKRQTHAYMRCLKLKRAVVLYFDKGGRSLLKEFIIDYDPAFFITDVRDRIRWHFNNLRNNILPQREGINPKMMPCMYCPYTHVCYDTEELRRFMKKFRPKLKFKKR